METYNKDIVKKLIERVKAQKEAEIKALRDELEVTKLEKSLNSDYNKKPEHKGITDEELDNILGGFDGD